MKTLSGFLLSLTLLFSSCDFFEDTKVLPASTGKAGELIVLIEKNLWETDLQDSLRKYIGYVLPGMPKAEAAFRLVPIPKSAFNSVIKTHRNILEVSIGSDHGFKKSQELFSDIQLNMRLVGKDVAELRKMLHEKGAAITQYFYKEELDREQRRFKKSLLDGFDKTLKTEQGFRLDIPKDYSLAGTATENTYHLRKDAHKSSLGLIIHVAPYHNQTQFELEGLIDERNQICKPNILGERSGSYMSIETRMPIDLQQKGGIGSHCVVAKGLWKMEHDFMGGPFVEYRILSPDQTKVITIDGYVYGPGSKKRNSILELEAIANSIRF